MATNAKTKPAENAASQILATAAIMFEERGYSSASLRDIAAEVGIKSASIFYHFENKDALLLRVIETSIRNMLERQAAALAEVHDDRSRLKVLIATELDAFLSHHPGESAEVVIHEWRHLDPVRQQSLLQLRWAYEQRWNDVLDACHRAGIVRADPRIARRMLNGAFAWANRWFREGHGVPAERLVDETMLLITTPEKD